MAFSSLDVESVCLAQKLWMKVLFVDLLWEKNNTEWLADSVDKLKIVTSVLKI
jgi:hypothetical protein